MPVRSGVAGPLINDLEIAGDLVIATRGGKIVFLDDTGNEQTSLAIASNGVLFLESIDPLEWPYIVMEPVGTNAGSGIAFKTSPTNEGGYEFFVENNVARRGLQLYSTEDGGTFLQFRRDTGGIGKPGIEIGSFSWPFVPDVNLYRSSINLLRTDDGFHISSDGSKGVYLDPGFSGDPTHGGQGYIELKGPIVYTEMASDAPAPYVNGAALFARDNGAGKSQLCVRFNTGAVQVLATQP